MSLIADAIKLTTSEKELHQLNYPFKTVPAMKIAKLAVSASFQETYTGIGFIPNEELNSKKRTKTVSMRRDILFKV